MKLLKVYVITAIMFCMPIFLTNIKAQEVTITNNDLSVKEKSIVTISSFTAKGDLVKLKAALNTGLDAGLTINEIKEIMVQLYAYTGFPRSLNALNTLMTVVEERKKKGITDVLGKVTTPVSNKKTKLQTGTENQTKLTGRKISGGVYEFAPAIDQFLKEHLFADIFDRDVLDWKTREIVTIAALASLGGTENQLRSHINVGMNNGLTANQLNSMVTVLQQQVGSKESSTMNGQLQNILNPNEKSNTVIITSQSATDTLFAKGEKIANNNFTGTAYLKQLIMPDSLNDTQVGNVIFEPGTRSNWHYHPGGQILIAISGTGYYQEKGSPIKILHKGDAIKCPPKVHHWHGASPNDIFVQLAITAAKNGTVIWLHRVSDEEYNAIQK